MSSSLTDIIRYAVLGPNWSATMLSLIEFALVPIPLVFYRYGHKIRQKSALIRQMREDRDKLDSRKRKAAEKAARHEAGGAGQQVLAEEKKEISV